MPNHAIALPVADPGLLGCHGTPLFSLYTVYVQNSRCFYFIFALFRESFSIRERNTEECPRIAIMVTIIRALMYAGNPPLQNCGSATDYSR